MGLVTLGNRKKLLWLVGGLVSGVLLGGVATVVSVAAAGGGHGSYLPAKLFFPFTMLSTVHFEVITESFIVLALAQFPLYGAGIGLAGGRGKSVRVGAVIALLHVIAVVVCFISLQGGSFDP
jgi:hypothetical protein